MGFAKGSTHPTSFYVTKPPKAEHGAEEWQIAMEALLLIAALLRPPQWRITPPAQSALL
jgi:hypothetical protein